jgi:hypothetical protein
MLVCVSLHYLARETAGAARTRSSLRPRFQRGQTNLQNPGDTRRGKAKVCLKISPDWHALRCHSGAMRKHRTRNPRIPRCAIAHLRSGAGAPSRMTRVVRARHILNRHRPRRRTIQYSERPVIEPKRGGVLDAPHSRGMTTLCDAGSAVSSTTANGGFVRNGATAGTTDDANPRALAMTKSHFSTIHAGAWSLAPSSPRALRSTPALARRGASAGLSRR